MEMASFLFFSLFGKFFIHNRGWTLVSKFKREKALPVFLNYHKMVEYLWFNMWLLNSTTQQYLSALVVVARPGG